MPRKVDSNTLRPTAAAKAEATTQAATEIIRQEVAARIAKTERLRAARLQRDATAEPPSKKPARKTRKA